MPRDSLVLQGAAAAVVGGVLALLALPGPGLLLAGVVVLQVLLGLALLEVLAAPGRGGAAIIGAGVVVAAGVVVMLGDGRVDGLAGVVALSLLAALLHQLLRRGRSSVTASLTDTMLVVVLVAGAGCLVALRADEGTRAVTVLALVSAAACLLAGRVVDSVVRQLRLVPGRGLPGLLLGLAAGAAVGVLAAGHLPVGRCALLGLAAAATAVVADLAAHVGTTSLPAARRYRVMALRHVYALLPYAVLGPVALVGGRLVLG